MTHTNHLRNLLEKDNIEQFITELLEATQQNGQTQLHSDLTFQSDIFYGNENQKVKFLPTMQRCKKRKKKKKTGKNTKDD